MNISTLLDPGAILPHRAHADDVGYDIHALTITIEQFDDSDLDWHPVTEITPYLSDNDQSPISRVIIDTGVHLTPPQGYYIELVPNSRISKSLFRWSFTPGIIDPNYTGSIKAILEPRYFFSYDHSLLPLPGTVVGQLIIRKKYDATFTPVSSLPTTTRGSNGFGSTASIRNS